MGRLANKKEFQQNYIETLQHAQQKEFMIPEFLQAFVNYPCNDDFLVANGKIRVKTYGLLNGEKFMKSHITLDNISAIMAIHDASHSVALFLTHKDLSKTVAIHSIVPFVFPTSLPYVLYYTQKYNFPLITTEVVTPVRELLQKNLLMKQFKGSQGGRWCTRVYKIEPSRYLLREFNLKGIVQLKGITRYQSVRRNKMYQGKAIDLISQEPLLKKIKNNEVTQEDYGKYFFVYQKFPIFEMTNEEMVELVQKSGLERNPPEVLFTYNSFDWKEDRIVEESPHGCMLCPFRDMMFYYYLKYQYPNLYNQCNTWREWACEKRGNQYYYFYNPTKPNSGSKIM
jgi:3'-phosphoadenosine 5'-phosphosulfate sulfotransferase (PAPS reductase)/FAD synthetase